MISGDMVVPLRETKAHVSNRHHKFKDKGLFVIGQYAEGNSGELDVEPFIKRMGNVMSYRMAIDEGATNRLSGNMLENWLFAAEAGNSDGVHYRIIKASSALLVIPTKSMTSSSSKSSRALSTRRRGLSTARLRQPKPKRGKRTTNWAREPGKPNSGTRQ